MRVADKDDEERVWNLKDWYPQYPECIISEHDWTLLLFPFILVDKSNEREWDRISFSIRCLLIPGIIPYTLIFIEGVLSLLLLLFVVAVVNDDDDDDDE